MPATRAEQRRARGVELDADAVDAALDDLVELLARGAAGDVVLVLADADALGIDLHQLGERILQAARDGDRAAHGEVEVGELLARDVARRVDARAGLADRDADDLAQALAGSTSRANASVSRPWVPLPTATARRRVLRTDRAQRLARALASAASPWTR